MLSRHLFRFAVSFLFLFWAENALAFVSQPLALSMPKSNLRCPRTPRTSSHSILILKMAGSLKLRADSEQSKFGPHIKIGKRGAILNAWGFWVMFYSVFIALFGYAYLKIRILLGALTLGLLKPKAEHCCWIMHAWCKLVLWLGFSNPEVSLSCLAVPPPIQSRTSAPHRRRCPQVTGLENLPPKGETILVAANHMSWFDVPVLSGYLGDRKLWSFAKGPAPAPARRARSSAQSQTRANAQTRKRRRARAASAQGRHSLSQLIPEVPSSIPSTYDAA